ncbi:MAG: hypothetical protein KKB57_18435 [Proteobacteria bacterium]|nr:hypothetical protein [Pseudomonadota bacterium]
MANRLRQPRVPLPEIHWSPNEQWVWRKVRRGEEADFNKRYGVCPLPWVDEAWTEEEKARRLIRPEFLYTVLLHEPWRSALSNWGFRLGGAYFAEPILMPHAEVIHEFWLTGCRIEYLLLLYDARFAHRLVITGCRVNGWTNLAGLHTGGELVLGQSRLGATELKGAQVGGDFSANHAAFAGGLAMDRAEIQGGLFMDKSRFEGEVRLHGVQVGGQVGLEEAAFAKRLAMDRAEIQGGLFMDKGRFEGETRLHGVRVGGQAGLEEATFAKRLAMDGAEIQGGLFMDKGRFEGEVRLHGAQVGGQASLEEATFAKRLAMDRAEIQGDLFMDKGRFEGEVRLHGVQVGGQVGLEEAAFAGDLTIQRAEILGELFMRQAEFTNNAAAQIIFSEIGGNLHIEGATFLYLDLTGTHAQAVVDNDMKWPDKLKLDHFIYQHLGGLGEAYGQDHMLDRPASWFTGWLAKHKPYSPQPYEQCAKVLREAGQPGKAKEILYRSKERERNEPNGDFRRWVWLTASKMVVGPRPDLALRPGPCGLGRRRAAAGLAGLLPDPVPEQRPQRLVGPGIQPQQTDSSGFLWQGHIGFARPVVFSQGLVHLPDPLRLVPGLFDRGWAGRGGPFWQKSLIFPAGALYYI